MSKKQKPRGFSLIEILIAFSLIVFVLMSTAQLLIYAHSVFSRYRDLVQSSHYLTEQAEHLRGLPFASTELKAGSYTSERTDPASRRTYTITWTIQDLTPAQKTVRIQCRRSGHARRRAETELLLLDGLGF
jgi:Tfp pilus assembly protein PilV